MFIQKKEIKNRMFPPEEALLQHLFDNKHLDEFVKQAQRMKQRNGRLSRQAHDYCQHYQSLLTKVDRVVQIMRSSKDGWNINKIDSKSELAVRVKGTNVEVRYEGTLTMDIENICVMIYQVNQFNTWVPFCDKAVDLKEVAPIEKIYFLRFNIPFLSKRYAYFYGLGIDRIHQNNTILIFGEGITENQQMMKKYNIHMEGEKTEEMVVFDLKFFICEITYLTQNSFSLKVYTELDTRMPILPEWIVNTVIKQIGGQIFDGVVKTAFNFKGSRWDQQMQADKQNPFYPWLHERIEKWHQLHKKKGSIHTRM